MDRDINSHSQVNKPNLIKTPLKTYKIKPNSKISIADLDPKDKRCFEGAKADGKEITNKFNLRLEELQEVLYAEHKHKVLIVLQALDTGGKDGVIRNVFNGVNPQGVKVTSFKVPTPLELDHDYLWRVHLQTPGKGEMVIFNRSHYEDILVVRVHRLVSESTWKKRYDHINNFEKMLADEGTTILKFFLNISFEEQTARLLSRLDESKKQWKFNPGDLKERQLWEEYMNAYEDVLNKTSTPWAPWFAIPADRKWYRDLTISSILVETLEALKMEYPKPIENIENYRQTLLNQKAQASLPIIPEK